MLWLFFFLTMENYYYPWLQEWWQCMSTNWTNVEISHSSTSVKNHTVMSCCSALDHNGLVCKHRHMTMVCHCSILLTDTIQANNTPLENDNYTPNLCQWSQEVQGSGKSEVEDTNKALHYACARVFPRMGHFS